MKKLMGDEGGGGGGACFSLLTPSVCESANIWNLHHFVSTFWSQFYLGF